MKCCESRNKQCSRPARFVVTVFREHHVVGHYCGTHANVLVGKGYDKYALAADPETLPPAVRAAVEAYRRAEQGGAKC